MPALAEPAPNTIPWPPLIQAGAAVAALALDHFDPIGGVPDAMWTGFCVSCLGFGLDVAAAVTLRRHRANILPHRAATRLVVTGPFAVSRNPIYLGNTILLIGLGLALENDWFFVTTVIAVWLVTQLAIKREERHLAAKFGPAWDAYRARVPRWLRINWRF